MKLKSLLAIFAAGLAGVLCGQAICTSLQCRQLIGGMFGRNVTETTVAYLARNEDVPRTTIDREEDLLKSQLASRRPQIALAWAWIFRPYIAQNLRSQRWIDRQLAKQSAASEPECREYFEAHQSDFVQPIRFRAAHLFLAAPSETPDEVVDLKRQTIEELSKRLKQGEKFSDLVAAFSEDEATKQRGGDLKYFSEFRMPADFVVAVQRLRVGEISDVVRTNLGFHLIQLTDLKSSEPMTFEQALPEIALRLENSKRQIAVQGFAAKAARKGNFLR